MSNYTTRDNQKNGLRAGRIAEYLLCIALIGVCAWAYRETTPLIENYKWAYLVLLVGQAAIILFLGLFKREWDIALIVLILILHAPPYERFRIPGWSLLLVLWAWLILRAIYKKEKKKLFSTSPLATPIAFFTGAAVLTTLFARYRFPGFMDTMILAFNFSLFLILAGKMKDQSKRQWIIGAFFALGFFSAFMSLVQKGHRVWALGVHEGLTYQNWPFGSHPNYTAYQILLALPFAFVLAHKARLVTRIAVYFCAAAMVLNLLLSQSRTVWVSLAVLPFVFLVLQYGGKGFRFLAAALRKPAIWAALVVFFGILFVLPDSFHNRLTSIALSTQFNARMRIWEIALHIVKDYPVLGPGLSLKKFLYPRYLPEAYPYGRKVFQYTVDAHNTYIEVFSSMGGVGLCALLWWYLAAFAVLRLVWRRNWKGKENERLILTASGAAFALVALDGMTNVRLWTGGNGYLIWTLSAFLAGVCVAFPSGVVRRRKPGLVLCGMIALALPMSYLIPMHINDRVVQKAKRSLRSQGMEEAGKWFRRAVQVAPFCAHNRFYVALCKRNAGDFPGAIEEFEKAVKLNPLSAFYYQCIGETYLSMNRLDDALDAFNRAYKLEPLPTNGSVSMSLGSLYLRLGRIETAIDYFTIALQMNPALAGNELWKRKGGSEILGLVIKNMERRLAEPDRSDRRYRALKPRLAEVLRNVGLGEDQETYLKRMMAEQPDHLKFALEAARMYIKSGRKPEASKILSDYLAANPGNPSIQIELGILAFNEGNLDEARRYFERSLFNWRFVSLDNHLAHRYLSAIHNKTGMQKEAAEERRKVEFLNRFCRHQKRYTESHGPGPPVWEAYHQLLYYNDASLRN